MQNMQGRDQISKKPQEETNSHEQLPEHKVLRSQMQRNVTDALVLFIKEFTVQHKIHNAIHVEKWDIEKRLAEVNVSMKSQVRSFQFILLIMLTIYFWVKCTSM